METAAVLVGLVVAVLAGAAVAQRLRIPAPLLLVAAGAAASYVPGMPMVELTADVVLLGLLPPLLYAAAIETSLVDFRANKRPILLLSVALIVATTATVGLAVHALLPGVGWPAALAIGAVVAPPDAVAATAIARRIGLPRRVVTILEGESLLNDATALVALRTAIAAFGGGVAMVEVAGDFALAAGGGVIAGLLVFLVVARVRRRVAAPVFDTALSFVTPFVAYLVAEEVHASGVISVVVSRLLLGHKSAILQTAQARITERITWRSVSFLLENTVFLLIGLQAQRLLRDVAESSVPPSRVVLLCVVTLAVVIGTRIAWVFASRALLVRRRGPDSALSWQQTLLIGWAGMRGVVTLAAAFVIPADVPDREVLLVIALAVVAGTLFLQGLTLPWLTRRLDVPAPDPAADALARATLLQQASTAGFGRLEELDYDDHHGVVDAIRTRLEQRTFAAWEQLGTTLDTESPSELYARIRLEMLEAERTRVLEIRDEGSVPAEIVREVLGMLDIEESMVDLGTESRESVRAATAGIVLGEECDDLLRSPAVETASEAVCARCVTEGTRWVALRQCLTCDEVHCCDSSVGRHATAHFHETQHPVMQSAEPEETWRWCFVHHLTG